MKIPAISRLLVVSCATFAFCAALPGNSHAANSFTRSDVETENNPFSVVASDLNRDGILDLAVTGFNDPSVVDGLVSVLLGNGDGTFRPRTNFPCGTEPLWVAAGDVNLDGAPDLLAANYANPGSVSVLLGIGDGSFSPAADFQSGIGPHFVAIADVNADGRPDAIVGTSYNTVFLHLGNGDGTFGPPVNLLTTECQPRVLIADLNADTYLDLAVIDNCSPVVRILLGNGDGTFQPSVDYPVSSYPFFADAGDLNADGHLDLVISISESSVVSVLMGNGDGTFLPKSDFKTGIFPIAVKIGDFGSDGIPDLAVSVLDGNSLDVLAGHGDGTFGPKCGFPTGFSWALAAGDWNRDGFLDLAVSDIAGGTELPGHVLSVFHNAPGVPVGNPPVVTAPATVRGDPNSLITFTVSAIDPDGDPIVSLRANGLHSGASFTADPSNTSGTFSWTPDSTRGTNVLQAIFVASNNLTESVMTEVRVNTPPVLEAIADMTVPAGSTADQAIIATHGDFDAITFTSSLPSFASLTSDSLTSDPQVGSMLTGNIHVSPPLGTSGTFLASVTATSYGQSDTKSFTITVTGPNNPPTLVQPANMTLNEGATANQSITATDPDGNPLTFSKVAGPAYMTVTTTSPGTGTGTGDIRLTPGFADAGTASATVRASDGNSSNDRSLTITVNDVPQPPVLAAIANMTVTPGATRDQGISATDADGDAIAFTSSGPTFMTLTSNAQVGSTRTGNIHLAPPLGTSGTFAASVTATANSQFDDQAFVIAIGGNTAPLLAQPANMTVNEGATANQSITAHDPDGNPITFTKVAGPTYVTVTTVTPGAGTGTGNINVAPGFADAGTASVTVRASDGSLSNDKALTLTVNNVPGPGNNPPTLAQPANMTVSEGAIANQTLSATDPDGDPLVFSKVSGPTYVTVTTTNPATGLIQLAPGFTDAGTASAIVRASDGGLTNDKSFTITVTDFHRAPVLAAIANMTVIPGATADQAISATDPDGDAITFTSSGPAFMTLTSNAQVGNSRTGNIHLAPPIGTSGTFQASVTATADSQVDDQTFVITVRTNSPPTLAQPANMTVNEGAMANQTITGTDPDGDGLTFAKVSGPMYATVTTTSATSGNIQLAPGFTDAGTASLVVNASDGTASDSKTVTTTVNNVDRAVVLLAIPDLTVQADHTRDQAFSATDPDGDAITFASLGPAFMTRTDNAQVGTTRTGNIHLAPPAGTSGTFAASVTATANATTSTRNFTINVTLTNNAPTLAQPANMTVDEGTTANQTLTATDPDGNPLTFAKVSGPTYATVTTTTPGTGTGTGNVRLAPGFSDFGTARATVRASDGSLSDDKSFAISIFNLNRAPVLTQPANMTIAPGFTADQAIIATDADGQALTFAKASGPAFMTVTTTSPGTGTATGSIHLAPGVGDFGTYSASVSASDGAASDTKSFTISIIPGQNRAPILSQPANMTVNEGATANQTLNATDADGNALVFSKVSGPLFMTVTTTTPGTGTATGNVHLAPGFSDFGTYSAAVRVSDGTFSDSKSFTITVNDGHRCPVANPGGPYSGLVGVAVSFDGTASSDPDGDALSYAWDFDASDGIGVDATGPTPMHAYPAAGTFTVTLTVRDNEPLFCSDTETTTATIVEACPATVFNGYDVIRLSSGRPKWFAFVAPVNGCYLSTDVVLSSFVLKYGGMQIPTGGSKNFIESDKNGDGIQEIRVGFLKADLRALFAGLPEGHNLIEVTIEANLMTGGILQGTTQVDVLVSGSSAVTVAPNPLNPAATLTFTTSRAGLARVELFDVAGRLVRTILDEQSLGAGLHEVRIEGRGQRGESLASGIYYIRGVSAEGEFTKRIAILK